MFVLDNIQQHAIKGARSQLVAQLAKFAIQFFMIAFLSRKLDAEDFGIFSAASAFTGMFLAFRDGGLSSVTIQSKEITNELLSNIFWINVIIGFFITICISLTSPIYANAINNKSIVLVCILLSMTYIFSSISSQFQAIMRRELEIKKLSRIEVFALVISVTITAIYTEYNPNYEALVVFSLSSSIVYCLLIWKYSDWRPQKYCIATKMKMHMLFGSQIMGANFLESIQLIAVPYVLTITCALVIVGEFNRAYVIANIAFSQLMLPLNPIITSALSKYQDDLLVFNSYSEKIYNSMLVFCVLVCVMLIGMSESITGIVLGNKWDETSKFLKWLALLSVSEPLISLAVVDATARNLGAAIFKWRLINTFIVIFSVAIPSLVSSEYIIPSFALCSILIRFPLSIAYFYSVTHRPSIEIVKFTAIVAGIALISYILSYDIVDLIFNEYTNSSLVWFLIFVLIYISGLFFIGMTRKFLFKTIALLSF